jgi:hypothetical protein
MNDALGNPIVFGEKYTFLDVNLSLAYGARVTGVALKTLKGKCGDKITLKILFIERFKNGESQGISENVADTKSVYAVYLTPVQKV